MAFSSVTVLFSKNGDAAASGWRQDLTPSDTITCSLSSTLGVSTYRWRLLGRPEGSGAGGGGPEPIALGNTSSCSFTADIHGTYIVECLVNGGAPDATILTGGCAILESITAPGGLPLRLLGPNETDEDISNSTVHQGQDKMLNRWLRLIEAGGVGGGAVLATDYNLGTSAADQTLTLTDAHGGMLVLDATSGSFTGDYALEVLVAGGVGAAFSSSGGLLLGPDNMLIGQVGNAGSMTGGDNILIGLGCSLNGDYNQLFGNGCTLHASFSLLMGVYGVMYGDDSIGLGVEALVSGGDAIAVGSVAEALADATVALGDRATAAGQRDIVAGYFSSTDGVGTDNILIASGGTITGVTPGQNIGIGYQPIINAGAFDIVLGNSTLTSVGYGVAAGNGNTATTCTEVNIIGQSNSVAGSTDVNVIGFYSTIADATGVVAIGGQHVFASGTGDYSATIGWNNAFAAGTGGWTFGTSISLVGGGIGLAWGETITLTGTGSNLAIGIGVDVTATDNQCVIGNSSAIFPENAIHEFIVRGYNAAVAGGVIDTLNVTDNPTNDFQTGLTIPYNTGTEGVVEADPVYAQPLSDLPTGARVLYFPGTAT